MRPILFTEQFWPQTGRIPSLVAGLARALGAIGVQSHVIHAVQDHVISELVSDSHANEHFDVIRLAAGDIAAIEVAIRDRAADGNTVLHAFTAIPQGLKISFPRVFTNCHTEFLIEDAAGRGAAWGRMLRSYDSVIATSDALFERTKAACSSTTKVWQIPLGVDTKHFVPNQQLRAEWRQQLWLDPAATVVLCPSGWHPSSGLLDFVHSLRHLEKYVAGSVPINVLLRAPTPCSDADYSDAVRNALHESRLGQFAHEIGPLAHSDMPGLYNSADVCVMPSLRGALSTSALESMACGVALVGTRVGGMLEVTGSGMGTLLVDAGNPPELATALATVVADRKLRESLAKAGRDSVRGLDFSCVAASVAAVYLDLLSNAPRARDAVEE